MSYAAPGITNIASEPRNQMDMEVEDRLAGGGATIDADVVTVGLVVFLNHRLGVGNGVDQGDLLRHRGIEPRGKVSPGNQQRVPGRYREGVPKANDLIMLKEDAIRRWLTKGTWHRRPW